MAQARADTPAGFADWVEPHLVVMARVAARLAPAADRDDIVQDALTQAWRRRETFDPDRGTAAAWLCTIVANRARRLNRRAPPPLEAVSDGPATQPDLDAAVDVERALRLLTARQREAVDLHYFAGLTVLEAAAVMGCSAGTVKSTLSDARAHLRTLLGESS